jgi:hypothetical protein
MSIQKSHKGRRNETKSKGLLIYSTIFLNVQIYNNKKYKSTYTQTILKSAYIGNTSNFKLLSFALRVRSLILLCFCFIHGALWYPFDCPF